MAVTRAEVRYIAELARLRFSEEEETRIAIEMSQILDYVDQLKQIDTSDVPPMSHVLDLHNVQRADVPQARISRDEALRNGPDTDDMYFRVPKVIT